MLNVDSSHTIWYEAIFCTQLLRCHLLKCIELKGTTLDSVYSCIIKCCNLEKLHLRSIKNSIGVSSKINNSFKTDSYPLNNLKEYCIEHCDESKDFIYFSYWILANGHTCKTFSFISDLHQCIFFDASIDACNSSNIRINALLNTSNLYVTTNGLSFINNISKLLTQNSSIHFNTFRFECKFCQIQIYVRIRHDISFNHYGRSVANLSKGSIELLLEEWPNKLKLDEIDNFNNLFSTIDISPTIQFLRSPYWQPILDGTNK